jgi:hypothetical protein
VTTTVRTPPNHDTLTCYTDYECRRPECVARARAYEKRRRSARAAGTWQPLVDAEPIRQHLLNLYAAGLTPHRIGAITGLPDRTIRGFTERQLRGGRRTGLRRRTTPEIARLILAINPDPTTAGKVDPTASLRRIHALTATGWPLLHIAQRTGIAYTTLRGVARQALILHGTATAIALAYEQLRSLSPTRNGVSTLEARKARTRAAGRRWPIPAYWDDPEHPIDDPHFEPEYGITRGEIVAEEARWLLDGGLTRDQAAQQLGVSRFYVDKALRDHPGNSEAAA